MPGDLVTFTSRDTSRIINSAVLPLIQTGQTPLASTSYVFQHANANSLIMKFGHFVLTIFAIITAAMAADKE
jgi:hypothetical protein